MGTWYPTGIQMLFAVVHFGVWTFVVFKEG